MKGLERRIITPLAKSARLSLIAREKARAKAKEQERLARERAKAKEEKLKANKTAKNG